MKLLIISPQASPLLTDAARVFRHIGYELQKRGHTVEYYLPKEAFSPFFQQTAELEQAIRIAPDIAQACRHKRYDMVIAPQAIGWCISTFRKWLLPRKTKVASWHSGQTDFILDRADDDSAIVSFKSSPIQKFLNGLNSWAMRQAFKTQDGFFFTSIEERDWVQQRYPLESRKAIYLPNGVSNAFYFPERYGQKNATLKLLSAGPLPFHSKCLPTVFTQLNRQNPELQLTLVNSGQPAEDMLQHFPPDMHASVTIIPEADEKALIAIYRAHDILILPTAVQGPPLTLLEGMASGLPVITSKGIGRQDLITHYQNGLLIPPEDANALLQALTHLLENPELCKQLGEAAYETASLYYTWRQVSDIFEEKLRQILHNKLPLPDWMIVTSNVK